MNVYKRPNGKWRAEVRHTGFYRSEVFESKKAAENWWSMAEAEYLAGKRGQPLNKSFAQAFQRYMEEVSPKKRGHRWEKVRLTSLQRDPILAGLGMADITSERLAKWRDKRLTEVKPSTVNRELNLIQAVLRVARREWLWIPADPMSQIDRPPIGKARYRRVSDEEIAAVVSWLGYAEDKPVETHSQRVAVAFLLAIETTMRSGDILAITPERYVRDRKAVFLPTSKNGDPKAVPLSARAIELLDKTAPTFFAGLTAASRDALFRKAVKKAGIENLHFHDSRHEAASRMASKVNMLELAKIMGVRDPRILMVYFNPAVEELAAKL